MSNNAKEQAKARKRELVKLLGGKRNSPRGRYAQIDPSRLVKVTLINGTTFWDHPISSTNLAYEFEKMGIIPREQVKYLYFWKKPTDREQFKKAIARVDTPHFSTQNWMKELGGK